MTIVAYEVNDQPMPLGIRTVEISIDGGARSRRDANMQGAMKRTITWSTAGRVLLAAARLGDCPQI